MAVGVGTEWQEMREVAELGRCLSAGRAGEAGLISGLQLEPQWAFLFLSLRSSSGPLALLHLSNSALRGSGEERQGGQPEGSLKSLSNEVVRVAVRSTAWLGRKEILCLFKFTSSSQNLLGHSPQGQ